MGREEIVDTGGLRKDERRNLKIRRKNIMEQSRGCLTGGTPLPCRTPQVTRVSSYVLIGHPPMRIMGRFFIWAILNMPGVRERWTDRKAGEGKEGRIY